MVSLKLTYEQSDEVLIQSLKESLKSICEEIITLKYQKKLRALKPHECENLKNCKEARKHHLAVLKYFSNPTEYERIVLLYEI